MDIRIRSKLVVLALCASALLGAPACSWAEPADNGHAASARGAVRVAILGAHAATDASQLAAITEELFSAAVPVTPSEQAAAAESVTLRLRQAGYPLAQAVLEQTASGPAALQLSVDFGELAAFRLENSSAIDARQLQALFEGALCPAQPAGQGCILHSRNMQRAAALVSSLPGVSDVAMSLSAGESAQGMTLVATIAGADCSLRGGLVYANDGTPAIGRHRLGVNLGANNLLRSGDALTAEFFESDKQAWTGKVDWNIPLGHQGLRFATEFMRSTYALPLGSGSSVTGTADKFQMGLLHPLTLNFDRVIIAQINAGMVTSEATESSLGHFRNRKITFVDLSLSGNSGLRALADPLASSYISWNATLTHGRPRDQAEGAAEQDDNGARVLHDFSKLFAQWAGRYQIAATGYSVGLNLRGQVATRNLDPSQALAVGGPNGVRAYRVDEGSFDDGYIASLDVSRSFGVLGGFRLTPSLFVDFAHGSVHHQLWEGWNLGSAMRNQRSLSAYGAGLGFNGNRLNGAISIARQMSGSDPSEVDPGGKKTQLWVTTQWTF